MNSLVRGVAVGKAEVEEGFYLASQLRVHMN
jgi:hypothetical protein